MIVVDASVVVDILLNLEPHATAALSRLGSAGEPLAAPHLLDIEVAQVLRRFVRSGQLTSARAREALLDLADLAIERYPHAPLVRRAFELRDNATIYDAVYLVLAEALEVPLLTRDAALAAVPGHAATVEVIR